jgi:MFS family permease
MEVGIVAAVSTLAGILFSIPAGVFSDRWGRRTMLLVSGLIFASAPFLYLVVANIFQLGLVRFYHGLATAIFVPVAMAYVSELHETAKGEKLGWFSSATLCGRFLAPVAGGGVMALAAASTFFAFGGVYLLCAMAGVMALFGALKVPARKISHDGTPKAQELLASLRLMVGNPGIMLTACVEAAILFAYGTMEVFLPLYAKAMGLGVLEIGVILSVQVITLAVTKPVMGRFSDRHGRAPQIIWGALAGSLCLVGVTFCIGFVSLMAASLLFGLTLSVVTSATSAAIADLSQCETRGSAMGIFGTVMDIGHSSGPILCGMIAGYFGYRLAFLGAAFMLAIATVFFGIFIAYRRNLLSCPAA